MCREEWVYEIREPVQGEQGWEAEIRRAPRESWRPGGAGPFFVVAAASPEVALREAREFVGRHGVSVPRVSVLLPVRNAAATLGECLASLAAQTLADHEVVAVDDHSTDGSRALLEARGARGRRVCASSAIPDRGLVAALNVAGGGGARPAPRAHGRRRRRHPERLRAQAACLEADAAV